MTEDLNSNLKDALEHGLVQSLMHLNLSFFPGGSRRFGYHHVESDIDYIVGIKDPEEFRRLINSLEHSKFHNVSPHSTYMGTTFGWYGLIHVVILASEKAFNACKQEHLDVDKLLRDEPEYIEFAKEMKASGVKGDVIFKSLVAAARSRKKRC